MTQPMACLQGTIKEEPRPFPPLLPVMALTAVKTTVTTTDARVIGLGDQTRDAQANRRINSITRRTSGTNHNNEGNQTNCF